jgi:hypothetical protein
MSRLALLTRNAPWQTEHQAPIFDAPVHSPGVYHTSVYGTSLQLQCPIGGPWRSSRGAMTLAPSLKLSKLNDIN